MPQQSNSDPVIIIVCGENVIILVPSTDRDTGTEIGKTKLLIYSILCTIHHLHQIQVGQHLDISPSLDRRYSANFYCKNLHPGSRSPAGAQKIQLLRHGTSRHA